MDLLIDIGGTNVRVAALADGSIGPVWRARTASFKTAQEIVEHYKRENETEGLRRIFLAVAGPVQNGRAALTNADLSIDAAALKNTYGLSDAFVFNDLEALAYSLAQLEDLDATALTPATPIPGKTSIAIAPGTGLGLAAHVIKDGKTMVVGTQGGHVRAAPSTPIEFELCSLLSRKDEYLCAEDLLSGPGVARIYAGLHEVAGEPLKSGDVGARDIVSHALKGDDARARETVQVYCSMLGSYCGDMALVFLAYGGVFLAGGLVNALAPFFSESRLCENFLNKGLMAPLMKDVALSRIQDEEPVLAGLKAYAIRQM